MSLQPIKMPALSDTMETGRLVAWHKKPGEAVRKGDVIAEVESDKAIMDVEAFADGYLQGPLAEPDSELPVGAVIGYLADAAGEGDTAQQAGAQPAAAEPSPPPEAAKPEQPPGKGAAGPAEKGVVSEPALAPRVHPHHPPAAAGRVKASPYARALARALGIDLAAVAPAPDGTRRAAQVIAASLQPPAPDLDAGPPWKLQPLTTMQRAVAEGMSASLHTPTFRVSARLPLQPLQRFAHGHSLSLTLLLARACALVVAAQPRFNAVYTASGLALRERVDVGIAVDVPDGLVTPVLRDVAGRPLAELSTEWQSLKEKVASRRLERQDYTGATFYLSNLGTFPRVSRFDAIVPLGAAAILAIGAEHDGSAEFTLSADHRVVYGADAARFLEALADHLEKPEKMTT